MDEESLNLHTSQLHKISNHCFPRGGTCKNFDRDARVIFLGLKFMKMSFFWVSLNWRHFFGVEKIAVIFFGFIENLHHFFGLPN